MANQFDEPELLKHLKMVLWDVNITPEEALSILRKEQQNIRGFDKTQLYLKIVNGFNWHQVRKIIPETQLEEALLDNVIQALFPRSLREKYRYVRALL